MLEMILIIEAKLYFALGVPVLHSTPHSFSSTKDYKIVPEKV
jgi:hypothetical protein